MRGDLSTKTPILSLPTTHPPDLVGVLTVSWLILYVPVHVRGGIALSKLANPVISRRRSQDPQPRGKNSPPPVAPEHCVPLAADCPLVPCSSRQVREFAISTRQSFLLLAHQNAEHTRSKQVRQSHLQLPFDAGKYWNRKGYFEGNSLALSISTRLALGTYRTKPIKILDSRTHEASLSLCIRECCLHSSCWICDLPGCDTYNTGRGVRFPVNVQSILLQTSVSHWQTLRAHINKWVGGTSTSTESKDH